MARGCSTLQPNFNKCDTNKYGQFKSDKYCYCKKSYCNTASKCLPNLYCLGMTKSAAKTITKPVVMCVLCYRFCLLHVPPPIVFVNPWFLQMTQKIITGKVMLNQLTKLDQWLTLAYFVGIVLVDLEIWIIHSKLMEFRFRDYLSDDFIGVSNIFFFDLLERF